MSKSKVTGTVDGVSDYSEKDYFNIALDNAEVDDNWYIGDGTLRDYGDVEKGDKVRLHVDDNQGSVTKVDIIGGGQNEDASSGRGKRGQSTDKSGSNRVSGQGESAAAFTSKQERIMIGAAGNQAAQVLAESGIDPREEQGELIEVYGELLNGFYNSMKAQVDDKTGEE